MFEKPTVKKSKKHASRHLSQVRAVHAVTAVTTIGIRLHPPLSTMHAARNARTGRTGTSTKSSSSSSSFSTTADPMAPGSAVRSRRRRRAAAGGGTSSSSSRAASSCSDFAADDDGGFIDGSSTTGTTGAIGTSSSSSSSAFATPAKKLPPSSSSVSSAAAAAGGTKSQTKKSSRKPPSSATTSSTATAKKKSRANNKNAGSMTSSSISRSSNPNDKSISLNRDDIDDCAAAAAAAAADQQSSTTTSSTEISRANPSVVQGALRSANELTGKLIPSSTLLRTIARASAAAAAAAASCGSGGGASSADGGLLLEEKLGDILSIVKKCLRAAMNSSSSSSSNDGGDKTPRRKRTNGADDGTSAAAAAAAAAAPSDDTIKALAVKIAHLRVAVHSLRAISSIVVASVGSAAATTGGTGAAFGKKEGQMAENTARLLYHAIVAAEDIFLDAPTTTSSTCADESIHVLRSDAACLRLVSCSILSTFLCGCGASSSRSSRSRLRSFGVGVPSPLLVSLAHSPTDKVGGDGGSVGNMTAVQVAKIGAQSLLSASTVMSSLFVDSLGNKISSSQWKKTADEFGFSIIDVLGRNCVSDTFSLATTTATTLPSFQVLVRTAAGPWLLALVNDTSKEGGVDGALSYSKRYQRMLWDCASQIDRHVSDSGSYLRRLSLGLRGDSIMASLMVPCVDHDQLMRLQGAMKASSELQRVLLKDRLEYACGCAWKAAASYSQNVVTSSSLDPTWYGGIGRSREVAVNDADNDALQIFHCRVGQVIEEFIRKRLETLEKEKASEQLPILYIEYCAYRSLHIGPDRCNNEGRTTKEHDDKENESNNCIQRVGRLGSDKCRNKSLESTEKCNQTDCLYSSLPFTFVHGQEHLCASSSKENGSFLCGSTTLCLIFATLQAFNQVFEGKQLEEDVDNRSGDTLISRFHSCLLSSSSGRRPKLSVVMQCQKMLASLKLSSRAMLVITAFESKKAGVERGGIRAIAFIQRVLGECYAPLLAQIASTEKSPKAEGKALRLEMAQDGYIRAIMLSDRLAEWTSSSQESIPGVDFKRPADKALRQVFQLASGSSENDIVVVARSIAAIGKQRSEREEMASALVPMLLSAELFATLFESSRSSAYKLPARFQQIATMFESIDMPNEAIAALVLSLHYQVREAKDSGPITYATDTTIVRCVEVIDCGEGPFASYRGDACYNPLIRLLRTLLKHYRLSQCETAISDASTSVTVNDETGALADTINRSRIGKTLDKALHLEQKEDNQGPLPIYRVFQLLIARSNIEGLELPAQMTLLSKALYMFGKTLSGEIARARDSVDNERIKETRARINRLSGEFTGFLKLALTCASKGRETISEPQYRKYEAATYLCASASFFLYRPAIGSLSIEVAIDSDLPNLLVSAIKYSKKAQTLLELATRGVKDDDERILLEVQLLAVEYYVSELSQAESETLPPPSLYEDMIARLENIIPLVKKCDESDVFGATAASLVFILAKIHSQLELSGNFTSAVRSASLIVQLQQSAAPSNHSDEALAVSNLASSLINGGFHGACRIVLVDFVQRSYGYAGESFKGAFEETTRIIFGSQDVSIHELDLLATALLVQVQSSVPHRLDGAMRILQDIAEMMEGHQECDEATTWIRVRWIQSTCLLALAQGMEKSGSVVQSLAIYKECSRICRNAMAFVRGSGPVALVDGDTSENMALCILRPLNMINRFVVRLFQSLQEASKLYCRQGDYERGEGYALSVVEVIRALPDATTKISKSGIEDLCLLLGATSSGTVRQAEALHFLVEIRALSRDVAMVSSEFGAKKNLAKSAAGSNSCPEWELQQGVRSMMIYGDILKRGREPNDEPSFVPYHQASYKNLVQITRRDFYCNGVLDALVPDAKDEAEQNDQFQPLREETRLRQASAHHLDPSFIDNNDQDESNMDASSLYRQVSESGYTPGISRAQSYYHLGMQCLSDARTNGELYRLWRGYSDSAGVRSKDVCNAASAAALATTSEPFLAVKRAQEYFTRAATFAGPASSLLSRQIIRSLALATGPHSKEPGYSAAILVHSSVGSTQRQKVAQAYTKLSAEDEVRESDGSVLNQRLALIFQALDSPLNDRGMRNAAITSMYQEASAILPRHWRFVAMSICPSGELLVSSLYVHRHNDLPVSEQTICIFPGALPEGASSCVYQEMLRPFDDIIERSRAQLQDMDSSSLDRYSDSEKKRMWWKQREATDEQLRTLLDSTETDYFSSDVMRNLIYGEERQKAGENYVATMCQGFDDSSGSDDERLECSLGNLADKFEAACAVMDDNDDDDDEIYEETLGPPEKMTVAQIKAELERRGVNKSAFKQLRKPALIQLLLSEREKRKREQLKQKAPTISLQNQRSSTIYSSLLSQEDGSEESCCTFLILDEDLQRFPFEGFKSMEGRAICRIPSVAFAVATLLERKQEAVKAENARYVLDPEANLASTKRTMLSALDSLTTKLKWKWERVVGEIPSNNFMETALEGSSLFLYCGHGGGEKCFSRTQVEKLMLNERDSETNNLRRCSSTVILMGCSSGKLVSVNSSRTSPPRNLALEYEPEGMAMAYLCAGAPCVVGNLWDVTDRDIDRYCMALLEAFLSPRGVTKSLPRCVANARSVCKMRHIVGCAPVVYGVPVVADRRKTLV